MGQERGLEGKATACKRPCYHNSAALHLNEPGMPAVATAWLTPRHWPACLQCTGLRGCTAPPATSSPGW